MFLLAPLVWISLAQDAPPATMLSGVVIDSSGKPMAVAEVWLADRPYWDGPKLLGEGRADAEGRFSIPRPDGASGGGPSLPIALWAYAPGHRLGLVAFEYDLPAIGEPTRIEVGPPAKATIRLEPPDSTPVKGTVEVYAVLRRPGKLPQALVKRLAATIGPDNVATLDGVLPEDIQGFDARTEAFGTQGRETFQPVAGDRSIRLRPVGHLSGRVVVADPSKAKGWKVTARTTATDDLGDRGDAVSYWEDTDDQGRFDIPILPAGALTITAQPPDGVAFLSDGLKGLKLEPGANLALDIPTERATIVEGFVREVGTGTPMPGVSVTLFTEGHQGGAGSMRTDDKGRYSKAIWPGLVTMHASGGPPTHLLPPDTTGRKFGVPPGVDRFTLPTIEMTRGESVRGVVLDQQGRPVAGALVDASYLRNNASELTRSRAKTRTDRSGAFLIQGIKPGSVVTLTAKKEDEAAQLVAARAGADSITLRLTQTDAIALKGRILGPDGRPLADATVQFKSKLTGNGPPSWQETRVVLDGVESIRTGPDGKFETPRQFAPNLLYRVEAIAAGMARAEGGWLQPGSTTFADLTLRRARGLRTVSGRVVDRAGEPIAGAVVCQSGDGPRPTRSVTDAAGRFRVAGVLDGPAFLFASQEKYRFQARPIGSGVGEVEIVLVRDLEHPDPIKLASSPTTRAEDKALARGLVESIRARIMADKDDRGDRTRLVAIDARLDPDRTIELIQNQVVSADATLPDVALGLIEDQPDEALDLIESDRNDLGASAAYRQVFDALGSSQTALRREVLSRAERRARAIPASKTPTNVDVRVVHLAEVADRWLDLGDWERAVALLRDARSAYDAVPTQGVYIGFVDPLVKTLARVDFPAAMALLDRNPAFKTGNRPHYENLLTGIAVTAAGLDPAEAERLLGQISQDYYRQDSTRQACYRMAARDLDRARRLASTLDDKWLPPLMTVIAARSKLATDPRAAKALFDAAFDEFGRIAESPWGRWSRSEVPAVMAMCLPIAAGIDPSLVPEYLARCLAARPDRLDEPDRELARPAAFLAMFLARYDREAASTVFEPVPEALFAPATFTFYGNPSQVFATIQAAAAFDPRAAMALLDRLPADPKATSEMRFGDDRHTLEARLSTAEALTVPPDRRRIKAAARINLPIGPIEEGAPR